MSKNYDGLPAAANVEQRRAKLVAEQGVPVQHDLRPAA
jgi:hypothetical protein